MSKAKNHTTVTRTNIKLKTEQIIDEVGSPTGEVYYYVNSIRVSYWRHESVNGQELLTIINLPK